MKFNKACHTRFDDCEFIEVLYHPILQMVAIHACNEETPTSIRWKSKTGKAIDRIHSKAFSDAIFEKMNWIKDYSFQFRGFFRESGNAKILFFSLDEPRIHIDKKNRINEDATQQEDEALKHFISCKRSDSSEEEAGSIAYPEEWKISEHGLNYAQRQRRDKIIESVSSEDIRNKGRKMVNPLIGVIPSRTEIEEELNQLLMVM